jgi:hypothetical protein
MNADFQRIRTSRIHRMSRHTASHTGSVTAYASSSETDSWAEYGAEYTARIGPGAETGVELGTGAYSEAAHRRRAVRSTLIVAALGAVAVIAAFMSPSAASGAAPAPAAGTASLAHLAAADLPAPVSGSPSSAFTRIADFYGSYIDAVSTGQSGELGHQLRAFYLTKQFGQALTAWESKNHADGVLRAQNTPLSWTVTSDGGGAGHTWAIVTLTWSADDTTRLHVQADLATQRISDIKPLGGS